MLRWAIRAAGVAAVLGVASVALAHGPDADCEDDECGWHQGWHMGPASDPGMTGSGMMGPGMMGPGMMGPGMMGPGMMGSVMPGWGQSGGWPGMMHALPGDLSAAEVEHMLEHHLAWLGNPNLRVGTVEEADEDTVVAEIVTMDGSLVQRLEIDRHTGWVKNAE